MKLKRISVKEVDGLPEFSKQGGLGTIYIVPQEKLIKIYRFDESDDQSEARKMSQRLEIIGNDSKLYTGLEKFCAVPEAIIENPESRLLIGLKMSWFKGYQPIHTLSDIDFCTKNRVTIRMVTNLFLCLHDLVTKIHQAGFIISDFNESNILFKFVNKTVSIVFVDIDSWAIRKLGVTLAATAMTESFRHPELDGHPEKLSAYHDWYSYSVLLARSLTKSDPFNRRPDPKTEAALHGTPEENTITFWDERIPLQKNEAMYIRRFGNELTGTLKKWLSGNQRGIFPKDVLDKFLDGLAFCSCLLEVHIDHKICTRCGEKLKPPFPRARNQQASEGKKETLGQLFTMG